MDKIWSNLNLGTIPVLSSSGEVLVDSLSNDLQESGFTRPAKKRRHNSDQDVFLACNPCRQKKVKVRTTPHSRDKAQL
jgi:hypothetical protein